MEHEIEVNDGAKTVDALGSEDVASGVTRTYVVTAEPGIFKRGRLWGTGETIDLDPATGQRFVELGELKEQG